jgi:hypothetical protein
MSILVAAVVLVGGVALVNLLLTYGVIRRLRQHTELLSQRSGRNVGDDMVLPVGTPVEDFSAVADDGTVVSPGLLSGPTLMAFFAPGCQPCAELLPRFLATAAATDRLAIAVVTDGDPAEQFGYRERLSAVATVVSGAQAAVVSEAFKVRGFPALCLVDGGVVTDSGRHLCDTTTRLAPV